MSKQPLKILIIEDNPEDRAVFRIFLQKSDETDFTFLEAELGARGIEICFAEKPDCVLLDYNLPDANGLEIIGQINPDAENPAFPVILLTSAGNERLAVKAIKSGAQDYLVKGNFSAEELALTVRNAVEIVKLRGSHRQTEANLRDSEERYRSLFELAAVGIARANGENGRFEEVNDEFCRITGYSREELLALEFPEMTHPDDRANDRKIRRQLARGEQNQAQYVKRYVRKDGQIIWVQITATIVRDESGKVEFGVSIVEDITESKAAEEALNQSEERLKLGVEVADFAICEIDYCDNTNHLSKEAAKLYGLGDEEMTVPRKTVHATFHPDDAKELAPIIAESLNPDGTGWFAREHRIVLKSGDVRWLSVRKQIFFDRTQNPPRAVRGILAAHDITERKLAEEQLRESQLFTQSIVDTAPTVLYTYNLKTGSPTYLTNQAATVLGYSFDDVKGDQNNFFGSFMHPADAKAAEKHFKRISKAVNGEVFEFEYRMRHKSGEWRWFRSRDRVFKRDENGAATEILGVALDITERKKATDELRESDERMRLATAATEVGVWEWNVITNQIRWDSQMFRLYGIEPTENGFVPYTAWSESVLPEELARQEKLLQETLNRGGQCNREFNIRRNNDGAIRYIEAVETVRLNHDGQAEWVLGTNLDVTERKLAEDELKASEEFNRSVLENSPDCVKILDNEGRLEFMNSNGLCLLEIDNFAVLKHEFWWTLWQEETKSIVKESVEKALKGETANFQAFCPTAKGTPKWWDVIVAPIPGKDGKTERLISVSRDITESKQAEIESSRLTAIVESSDDAIISKDFDGTILSWNAGAERIFGYTAAEAVGQNITILFPSERLAEEHEVIATIQRGKHLSHYETVRVRKDGTKFPVSLTISPVKNAAGEIVGISKIARDITEIKHKEEELSRTHYRLENVLSSISDGLLMLDKNWVYTYFSEKGAELIGMKPEDLIGKCVWDVFPNAVGTKFHEMYHRAVETGQPVMFEEYYPAPLDQWLECHCYPSGEGLSVYFHDITERKNEEARQRAAHDTFRQLVENSPFGIYVVDADFRLAQVGAGAQKFFENVHPLIGRDFAEILRILWQEPFAGEAIALFRRTLETGEPFHAPSTVEQRSDIDEVETYDWKIERITLPDGRFGVVCHFYDLSERQRYEAAIKQLSDYNRDVLESITDPFFTLDRDWRFTYMNEQGERLVFHKPNEILGKTIWNEFPGLIGSPFEKIYRDGMDKGVAGAITEFFPDHNRWYEVSVYPAVNGVTVYFRDLTERKRYEMNLAFLAEVSLDLTRLSGVDEIMQVTSGKIGRYFGTDTCAFARVDTTANTSTIKTVWLKDDTAIDFSGTYNLSEFVSDDFRRTLLAGKSVVINDVVTDERTGKNAERYAPLKIASFINTPFVSDGDLKFVLGVWRQEPYEWRTDEIELLEELIARVWTRIERARAEEKLRESEEIFRLASDAAAALVYDVDLIGKRQAITHGLERVTGYTKEEAELSSAWFHSLIHPDDLPAHLKNLEQQMKAGDTYRAAHRLRHKNGEWIWVEDTGKIIRNENSTAIQIVGAVVDVTGRRQSELALRESEERFRSLFDSIDEGFCIIEMIFDENNKPLDYRFVQANPAMERLTGLTDALGKTARELVPDLEEFWFETYGKVALTGESVRFENQSVPMKRWFEVHASRVGNEPSHRVAIVFNDITERKKAEAEIETANFRFRAAESAVKGFNYEWNLTNGEVTRSESFESVTGYRREEIKKTWRAWADLLHPDDLIVKTEAESLEFVKNIKEDSFGGEYRIRHKKGHYLWVLERAVVIRNAQGEVSRVIGQTIDITERKEAQEKLLEAERRAASDYRQLLSRIAPLAQTLGTARELSSIFRALLEFIRFETPCEGFFVSFYEEENHLKRVKYVWCEGAELNAEQLKPITLGDGANSRAIRTGKSVVTTRNLDKMNGEFEVIGKNDSMRPVYSLVTPMIVMGRVIGTLEAQNHKKKYVQENIVALEMAANLAAVAIENVRLMNIESDARAAAEEANRSKDEFLAVLSHELRTPLNSIKGWVSMLQNHDLDQARRDQAVEVISRNVNSQNALIEDILDVSRIISGKMKLETERISFVSVVQNALDALRPIAEKKSIDLTAEIDALADEMNGDTFRLQQIINNLLNNAVKFTPEGGVINVRLERLDDRARLTVADTGIGIAAELLPRIFDRFQQADGTSRRKYNGLGLGLAIVKHLTELHGGAVFAHSAGKNKGTIFTVELPLISQMIFPFPDKNAAAEGERFEHSSLLEGLKLLIVDDEPDTLEMMRVALQNFGAEVTGVDTARKALAKLDAEKFDALISDVGMAEMDGCDLIRHIREKVKLDVKTLPAIALSGYVSADDRQRSLNAGFQKHLGKPVDVKTLPHEIKTLIEK